MNIDKKYVKDWLKVFKSSIRKYNLILRIGLVYKRRTKFY